MYVFGVIRISTLRRDPFIVYTSNIFAILGLRAMVLPARVLAEIDTLAARG